MTDGKKDDKIERWKRIEKSMEEIINMVRLIKEEVTLDKRKIVKKSWAFRKIKNKLWWYGMVSGGRPIVRNVFQ